MSDTTRRRLRLLFWAFLVAVVVTGFLVPIVQRRLERNLAPLSDIELGTEPGKVQFAPLDGATDVTGSGSRRAAGR